ncbi:MAG: hypothetical protein N2645_20735 [Clostridia bacterium]|nr:hypothetical protein [Clostridia bacterium]
MKKFLITLSLILCLLVTMSGSFASTASVDVMKNTNSFAAFYQLFDPSHPICPYCGGDGRIIRVFGGYSSPDGRDWGVFECIKCHKTFVMPLQCF